MDVSAGANGSRSGTNYEYIVHYALLIHMASLARFRVACLK